METTEEEYQDVSNCYLSIEKLIEYCNPFTSVVWPGITHPITKEEIAQAIEDRKLFNEPLNNNYNLLFTREQHIQRIAYLVEEPWTDPIQIDVGIPVLNYYRNWLVTDGNHRLAAAIYRDDKCILSSISGQLDYAEKLFGVKIR